MKRFMLTAVAVLSLLAVAVPAFAQLGPAFYPRTVNFVSENVTTVLGTTAPVFINGSCYNTTMLDTTAAISLNGAFLNESGPVGTSTSATTGVPVFLFTIEPAPTSGSTWGLDTMGVVYQVSKGPAGPWTTVDSLGVTGTFSTDTTVMLGTVNKPFPALIQSCWPASTPAAATVSSMAVLARSTHVRFIISRDDSAFQNGNVLSGAQLAATSTAMPRYTAQFWLYSKFPTGVN